MLLRQLFDKQTSTFTYVLADESTRDAIVIDPVDGNVERDHALLGELGLRLKYSLDTHVHADHVTGSGRLRELTNAQSVAGATAGVGCVDIGVSDGDRLEFGQHEIEVRATPGHTAGCISYVVRDGDRTLVFTGDALLIRGCGRTDFQQGDAATLYDSIHRQLFSLPDDTVVYPGHDYRGFTSSTIGEEKANNPRLKTGTDQTAFVAIMNALDLADPAQMDVAVSANLACGRAEPTDAIPQLTPADVSDLSQFRILDVREPKEFTGELGHLDGADLVPLATLARGVANWPRDARLLVVCRSGRRSNRACGELTRMGFTNVANLAGGMLAWRASEKESN